MKSATPFLLAGMLLASLAPCSAAAQRGDAEREAARAAAADAREAMAQTRAELREAQRELQRLSERVAVLAQKSASVEIARAFEAPAFGRAGLGIVMAPDEHGLRLAAVTPGSPAAEAGLRGGDRLVAIRGEALHADAGPEQMLARARVLIGELEEGEQVELAYQRGGERRSVQLEAQMLPGLAFLSGGDLLRGRDFRVLSALHPVVAPRIELDGRFAPFAGCSGEECDFGWFSQALRWRGLRLAEVDAQLGRYFGVDSGVLVLKAEGEGLDALQPGDVIVAVAGKPVDAPSDAMRLLGDADSGAEVELTVQRDRRRQTLAMTVPELARWQVLVPPTPPAPPSPPAPPAHPRAPSPAQAPPAPPAPPPPREGILDRVLM